MPRPPFIVEHGGGTSLSRTSGSSKTKPDHPCHEAISDSRCVCSDSDAATHRCASSRSWFPPHASFISSLYRVLPACPEHHSILQALHSTHSVPHPTQQLPPSQITATGPHMGHHSAAAPRPPACSHPWALLLAPITSWPFWPTPSEWLQP